MTTIQELWDISDSGKAEWWPDAIVVDGSLISPRWWYVNGNLSESGIADQDALYIVIGHAEEWLEKNRSGWACRTPYQSGRGVHMTLLNALKWEAAR